MEGVAAVVPADGEQEVFESLGVLDLHAEQAHGLEDVGGEAQQLVIRVVPTVCLSEPASEPSESKQDSDEVRLHVELALPDVAEQHSCHAASRHLWPTASARISANTRMNVF